MKGRQIDPPEKTTLKKPNFIRVKYKNKKQNYYRLISNNVLWKINLDGKFKLWLCYIDSWLIIFSISSIIQCSLSFDWYSVDGCLKIYFISDKFKFSCFSCQKYFGPMWCEIMCVNIIHTGWTNLKESLIYQSYKPNHFKAGLKLIVKQNLAFLKRTLFYQNVILLNV